MKVDNSNEQETPFKSDLKNDSFVSNIGVYRWIMSFVTPYKKGFILLILYGLIITSCEMVLPKVIQFIIDKIVPEADILLFMYILFGVIIILIMMFYTQNRQNVIQKSIGEQVSANLQFAIFQQLRSLGFSYFDKNPVGEVFSMFDRDVQSVQKIYREFLPNLIIYLSLIIFSVVMVLSINVDLGLILIPCFLLYRITSPLFGKKSIIYGKKTDTLWTELNRRSYDSISALPETLAYGSDKWDLNRLITLLNNLQKNHLIQMRAFFSSRSVRVASIYLSLVAMFAFGSSKVKSGELSIGAFVSCVFYLYIAIENFAKLVTDFSEQQITLHQARRLKAFMSMTPEVIEEENSVMLPRISGELTFINIHFGYLKENDVVNGVDLKIAPGEKVAIVGSSGSGKSTLLKLVGRFYDPTIGEIYLEGVPLRKISLAQLREVVGYVFQDTYLFGSTVLDNIKFGNPEATFEEVKEAAKAAYAEEFIEQLSHGYNTILGERGVKLSGGQKQRLAIARMLVKKPAIILLDEATSALDNHSESEIQKSLDALLINKTVLTVAHRLSTIRKYDRIIVMEKGKIVEFGKYDELIDRKGYFYNLSTSADSDMEERDKNEKHKMDL